jgi:MSHA biogenesis protein MshQ
MLLSADSVPEPEPEPVDPGTGGLVAYYARDNDVTDGSGNGLDGTIMGDPNFVEGIAGMALDLDGDGDYVDCGTNDVLNNLSDAMTVSAWVNIRSVNHQWMSIVMKGETAWRLGTYNNTSRVHFGFTGGTRGWQEVNSETELALGEWYQIAAMYKSGVGAIAWVDGVAEAVNPDPDGTATNEMPLYLGENPESAGRFYDGLLDEVRIYDRALSEAEMLYLAGERATPVDPGADGLVAYYALENDANDSSGNGLDGTIVGEPNYVEGPAGYGMAMAFDGVDD